jgi:GGDEF domain-containing protein
LVDRLETSHRALANAVAALNAETDRANRDSLTGLLNRSYAAIIATQDQLDDLKSNMESAGMIPPQKLEKKGGRNVGATGG